MEFNEKLSNPQKTIEVIQKYEFTFQKKFGQNFLIDSHVLNKIIASADITKDDFCTGDWTWYRNHDPVSGLRQQNMSWQWRLTRH